MKLSRVLRLVLAVGMVTSLSGQEAQVQVGDRLTLNSSSIEILRTPRGEGIGDVTRHDLQTNGDVIIASEVRQVQGETWVRVRITAGKQENQRYKMPDTTGWFRLSDVSKSTSARPYGAPPTWLQRLRKTIGVDSVVDSSPFVIKLQTSFWLGLDANQQGTVARGHIDTVWRNRPRVSTVELRDENGPVATSSGPGQLTLVR